MFVEFDQSLVRRHNEELMHEARKWHLQRSLRANREQSLGTRPQVDSSPRATGVIDMTQLGAAHMKLQPRDVRPVGSMKALGATTLTDSSATAPTAPAPRAMSPSASRTS